MESRRRRPQRLFTTAVVAIGGMALVGLGWLALQQPGPTIETELGQGQNQDDVDHDHDHDHPSILNDNGRFTGPGDVWPPEPRNATDKVDVALEAGSEESQQEKLARIESSLAAVQAADDEGAAVDGVGPSQVLLSDARVSEALGDGGRLVAVDQGGKGLGQAVALVYFSRSTNKSVQAVVDGDQVVELLIQDAAEFQPPLEPSEEAEAVQLARAHWQTEGDARIDQLEGFGILAFEPDGTYYDTRMVYISFHTDVDARPELITWVDLSNGSIHKAEVDR